VEVRHATNELPAHADVSLQAVIREWDSLRQSPVLTGKLRDLELARLRVAPECIELVEGYHRVLANFMRHRGQTDLVLPVARVNQPRLKPLVRETLKQLDELDAKRMVLRTHSNAAGDSTVETNPPFQNSVFPQSPPREP
jgi:hypothetical protein